MSAQLITINFKQPVKMTGQEHVNLRDIFNALEVKGDLNFSLWAKRNLKRFKENTDFGINIGGDVWLTRRGRPAIEYWVTVDAAKMIAMMSATPKGDDVRKYFLECEKLAMEGYGIPTAIDSTMMKAIAESMERLESQVKNQEVVMTQSPLDLAEEHAKPLKSFMVEFKELRDKAAQLYHDAVVNRKAGTMTPTGMLTMWIRSEFKFYTLKRSTQGGKGSTVTQYNRADILQVVKKLRSENES